MNRYALIPGYTPENTSPEHTSLSNTATTSKNLVMNSVHNISALKKELKEELDRDWSNAAAAQWPDEKLLSDPSRAPELQEAQAKGAAIQLRGIKKVYGERQVLKALNLDVKAGEFVAVIGRSGCGKSTLLRLIAGLEKTDGGEISFNQGQKKPDTRVMFQDSRLLPWKNVLNNVALGLDKNKGVLAAKNALEKVALEERATEWPSVLSGGQRQRVALARALVHEPELLLLDEPLGALDALTRIEMQSLIEELWLQRGFTALLVTHDVQEAIALADRVILIEDGQITLDERVSFARPRARGNPAFAELEERILKRVLRHPASVSDGERDNTSGDISLLRTVSQVSWAI